MPERRRSPDIPDLPETSASDGCTRRQWLARSGAGVAGLMTTAIPGVATAAEAQSPAAATAPRREDVSVARRGTYAQVALRQDFLNVCAIQSRVRAVDAANPAPGLRENLQHVLDLIDNAQGSAAAWGGERLWGSRQDLICLHEFPIQGWQPWSRDQLQRVAFDLPGPESEAIGERAKRYDCYIAFGCYARDPDWPGHVINMSVIVGPSGQIVARQWKSRNILGAFGDVALIGTTIYDVLDRYVEMYGWDAVVPIARTDIGNLAMTAVGNEPALYQAMALKGVEILMMTVTGGSNAESAIATARANRVYCLGVGNSVSFGNPGFAEAAGAQDGGTVIVDPRGMVIARTSNHHEDFARARVPIADFRKSHRPIEVPMALLLPVFQRYEPAYAPNAFLEYLPKDYRDAAAFVRRRMERPR